MKKIFLFAITFIGIAVAASAQNRLYVNGLAAGQNNGLTWADAFTDLHQALANAQTGDEVWVAKGEYRPDTATNRDRSFVLKSGVKFYGSFAGTETDVKQRDIMTQPTLLSGNIGDPADSTDNAYTILYMSYPDTSTYIDGFTFRHGYAYSDTNFTNTSPVRSGAAVYVMAKGGKGMPRFANCVFRDNYARNFGGAYFVFGQSSSGSTPMFRNCMFINNKAGESGGAIYVSGGNSYDRGIEFDHCRFDLNACYGTIGGGGGVFMSNSFGPEELNFWGCEITRNQSMFYGAFLYMYRIGTNPVRLDMDSCNIISNGENGVYTMELDFIPLERQTIFKLKKSTFLNGISSGPLFYMPSSLSYNSPLVDTFYIGNSIFLTNKCRWVVDFRSFHICAKIENNLFFQNGGASFEPNFNTAIRARGTNIEISKNAFVGNLTPIEVKLTSRPNSHLLIEGNLFYNNKKSIAIDVFPYQNSPDLEIANFVNNIFVKNVSAPWTGSSNASKNILFNNIFIGNKSQTTGQSTLPLRLGLDTFYFSHNLFDTTSYCTDYPNVTCGPNNLFNLDPLFRDTTNLDYSLLPCSPLIDAGSNAAAMGILTDIAGNPRIQGGTVDIGAYESPAFALAAAPEVQPACVGTSNGSISLSPVFGCEPYVYDWSPMAGNGPELNGLPPGPYIFTIIDGSGRQILDTVLVALAPQPSLALAPTDVQCGSTSGGSLSASVASGTAPFQYTWLPGAADTALLLQQQPGDYALTVVDANGCQDSASASIALLGMLTPMIGGQTISCFGAADGWLSLTPATGAAPFQWQWEGWPGTDSIAQPLGPGNYSVTVTDAYGCTASNTFPTMTEPGLLVIGTGSSAQTQTSPPNGAAVVTTISGGTSPFYFEWEEGSTTQAIAGLNAGTYTVTVTDENGCAAVAEVVVELMISGTEEADGLAMMIYPNPAADWVKIVFSEVPEVGQVEISDVSGRVIRSESLSSSIMTLDLRGLPGGSFVVTIRGRQGKAWYTGKVVKI